MKSSWPVNVITCATFQFALVKVTEEAETVPSAVLGEVSENVTLAVGLELRMIENVAVPPASVVARPIVGLTVMPGVSSSVLTAETSAGFKPLYFGSVLVAAAVMIE